MGRTKALAVTTLAILSLLAGAAFAHAQCDPTTMTEGGKVGRTLGLNREIVELETIRDKIEKEHHVVIVYTDEVGGKGASMITSQQAGELFGARVFEGRLDPASIPAEIARIRLATNIYLRDYILPDLEEARKCWAQLNGTAPPTPAPTTPSAAASAIEWPAPMDWIKVKGVVRGSYVAECAGYRDYPAIRSAGTWRLELLGDGNVRGIFVDGARESSGIGSIKTDGSASGVSRSSNVEMPLLGWTARFERSGVDLLMSSHTLDLRSAERGRFSILVECKPGYMRQE
jgi:hypothetical protein